jgi:hypothetical protein
MIDARSTFFLKHSRIKDDMFLDRHAVDDPKVL